MRRTVSESFRRDGMRRTISHTAAERTVPLGALAASEFYGICSTAVQMVFAFESGTARRVGFARGSFLRKVTAAVDPTLPEHLAAQPVARLQEAPDA